MSRYVKMNIEDAEYFDMFDNVEFQYLKNIYDVNGDEFSILDLDRGEHWIAVTINVEGLEIMNVSFEFDLGMCLTRPFVYKCNFNRNSPHGIKLDNILYDN
jgi:hypothetical protein